MLKRIARAIRSARPIEAIQAEYEQVTGAIGERKVRQWQLEREIRAMTQRALDLQEEARLAGEKLLREGQRAEGASPSSNSATPSSATPSSP